ncbi:Chitin synthase, class 2, partial [Nowakowskiella sp. JEL0407]
ACGEIKAELGNCGVKLFNPLVAAQNFEYKMSNILDKPLESVFGFISVLPGAFSAYRYEALQNGVDGTGPLEKYFHGEKLDGASNNIQTANMYLAEDRILCFELVTKKNCKYILKYVSSARAETDVPEAVAEFISQRRRWLNGSFFATVHSIIFRTSHGFLRKIALLIQTFYNLINIIFSWFALANWYLILFFLTSGIQIREQQNGGLKTEGPFYGNASWITLVIRNVYLLSIIMIFLASFGNRPQGTKRLYIGSFFLFALIMAAMLYTSAWTIYLALPQNHEEWNRIRVYLSRPAFRDLVLSMMSTYGMYFIVSILHRDPWHMITSFIQYLLLLPSFVNILTVYAFCNLHDVSWGTKGDNVPKKEDPAPVTVQSTEEGKQVANVHFPNEQQEIEEGYERFKGTLMPELKAKSKKLKKKDKTTDSIKQEVIE